MKESDPSRDEKHLLRLLARNFSMARREWAIVGCLCTLGVGLLVYMVIFSLGPNNPISAICDVGILAIESDAYQRVFEVL